MRRPPIPIVYPGAQLPNAAEGPGQSYGIAVHAIARLVGRVRAAYRVLGDLQACMTSRFSGVEELEAVRTQDLNEILELLGRQVPVLLDLMGMYDTRDTFLSSWKGFDGNLNETFIRRSEAEAVLVSRPLEVVDDVMDILGAGAVSLLEVDPPTLATLEYILRSTPQILAKRGIVPKKEADVQRALHDHLECSFKDYNRTVKLPKGLKSFEPDGAIESIETLIEVKFVDTRRKIGPIVSEIMEDLSGYAGSKDWSRFYSLIYQTEPFVNESRFEHSLRLSKNAGSWKSIVVTGSGGRDIEGDQAPKKRKGKGGA